MLELLLTRDGMLSILPWRMKTHCHVLILTHNIYASMYFGSKTDGTSWAEGCTELRTKPYRFHVVVYLNKLSKHRQSMKSDRSSVSKDAVKRQKKKPHSSTQTSSENTTSINIRDNIHLKQFSLKCAWKGQTFCTDGQWHVTLSQQFTLSGQGWIISSST